MQEVTGSIPVLPTKNLVLCLGKLVSNYNQTFYDSVTSWSLHSVDVLVPLIKQTLFSGSIKRVLDVGCGTGAFLRVWDQLGVEGTGIDGDFVDESALVIPKSMLIKKNLNGPFDLKSKFDLVQSLEVGVSPKKGGR